jgi:hypothetical protein
LLQRNEDKLRVLAAIDSCAQSELYIHSNEFKFLFLLYGTGMQKRHHALKRRLRNLFLSSRAVQIELSALPSNLVILRGLGNGEILNSNETFKATFGLGYDSQIKPTIAELFPSSQQKSRHIELMNASVQSSYERQKLHKEYPCLLTVERELAGVKFKAIEEYCINTRIYYEFREGFNYVC